MKPIAALFAVLAFAISADALACTCAPNPPVPEAVERSTRVFLGTVTAIERHDGLLQHVTFQVTEHFKGSRVPSVVIENHASGPMCGYPFQEGGRYIVYARGERGALTTTSCSRTTMVVQPGSDLEVLRATN